MFNNFINEEYYEKLEYGWAKRPRVHQSHPQLHKGQFELHRTLSQRNQSRGLLEKTGDPSILKL